ncbi:MAG: DNA integrity scanning protein DisA nucleotide-binding domain protein [Firmicutes bacterium]|nr:DNA integrity scanning protein DisA nucleotide-binding domain protein [Candidatus Caballimonas caccae]
MALVNAWNNFISKFSDVGFIISFILSIILFTLVYFFVIKVLNKNNSSIVISLISLAVILTGLTFVFNENLDGVFFLIVPLLLVVMSVSLFSIELKRYIWARAKQKSLGIKHGAAEVLDEEKVERCIDEIIKALQDMAKNDVGALIVLSTGNVPSQIIESGVKVNSEISSELIESIFFPKTPLHDGAMILNGTQIVSAGCFLPLSQKIDTIQKDLGTRHRAGIEITENIDVISIIVSEETGIISIAKVGMLTGLPMHLRLRKF